MICNKCTAPNADGAKFCNNCGAPLSNTVNNNYNGEYNGPIDNPSHFAGLVSCCFPVVGLILYFLWKDEKPKSSKVICYWLLGGIGTWIILYILFIVIAVASNVSY